VPVELGVLDLDGEELRSFPPRPELEFQVDMGVYAIARSALARVVVGRPVGIGQLIEDELADGGSPKVYRFDGCWLDITRPEDYDRANVEFRRLRATLVPEVDEADAVPHQPDGARPPASSVRPAPGRDG
jgi:mannose-1-phosphate guanylyltransferase